MPFFGDWGPCKDPPREIRKPKNSFGRARRAATPSSFPCSSPSLSYQSRGHKMATAIKAALSTGKPKESTYHHDYIPARLKDFLASYRGSLSARRDRRTKVRVLACGYSFTGPRHWSSLVMTCGTNSNLEWGILCLLNDITGAKPCHVHVGLGG